MQLHRQNLHQVLYVTDKKDKLVTRVLREMKFFAFLSLTFNFNNKFEYIKRVYPAKSLGEVVGGVREGQGMDKIMGFYISPDLMFSTTFFFVIYFHNHLCISISPKIHNQLLCFLPLAVNKCGLVGYLYFTHTLICTYRVQKIDAIFKFNLFNYCSLQSNWVQYCHLHIYTVWKITTTFYTTNLT